MKHLKQFESNFYNVGDIVILDDIIVPNVGVILDVHNDGEFENSTLYNILLHNNQKIYVGRKQIKHFPTPYDTDEIKDMVNDMKIMIQANNYNI
jgi:hypothetical protein